MSRIGKKEIVIEKGVELSVKDNFVEVKGPKGELSLKLHPSVKLEINGETAHVHIGSDLKADRSLQGLYRTLVNNMIIGVTQGFSKNLEIVGVGYRAEQKKIGIKLALGYSHPVIFIPPEGIEIKVNSPTTLTISGIDKALVGEVAAKIRNLRPPEPYKGKGIRYENEIVRRKAGKTGI